MTNEQTLEFLTTAANQHASDIILLLPVVHCPLKRMAILLIMENV